MSIEEHKEAVKARLVSTRTMIGRTSLSDGQKFDCMAHFNLAEQAFMSYWEYKETILGNGFLNEMLAHIDRIREILLTDVVA